MNIHIGKLIEEHFNKSGMTLIAFANKTFLQRQNIRKSVFDKMSIDTEILVRISKTLGHNFFQYYLEEVKLPSDGNFTSDQANNIYSPTVRKKVKVSFDIDDPDIKTELMNLLQRTA